MSGSFSPNRGSDSGEEYAGRKFVKILPSLPTFSARAQERSWRRYHPRYGHPGFEQNISQALYMVDEEGESFLDGLLYPAFYEERSFVMQDVAAPLVDGAEDRRLEQAPLVFDQQEVHTVPALRRGTLEAFDQTCRAGVGTVRQLSDPHARNHPELSEGIAVRHERMPVDVETEHLPLHPLSGRVREGEMPDAPSLPQSPPARRVLYGDLLLSPTPPLLRKGRTLVEEPGSPRPSNQRVEEASPGEVDLGREHAEPDPTRLVQEQPRAVEAHRLGVENGCEELSRVVAPHVRARVGELRKAGGVRGRETVDREPFHPREDLLRFRGEDPILPRPPHELQAQLPHRARSPVLGHGASQEIALGQGEARDGVRHGEDLFLKNEDAVSGTQYLFEFG